MHEVPVVDVTLIVKSGAAADPAGKYGLASFTAAMLDEGAGTRNALELADAVDFLGASLSTGSSWDSSTVRLHTPVAKLDEALPLMADVAAAADLPADRARPAAQGTADVDLLQTRDNAPALASAAFARAGLRPAAPLRHAGDGQRGRRTAR